MPLAVLVQPVEERDRARVTAENRPNAAQRHADARSVIPPISTIRTSCGHPATALLCMNEQGGRRLSQAWVAKRAALTAIRLNANDPSACTALSSGHFLGTDAF